MTRASGKAVAKTQGTSPEAVAGLSKRYVIERWKLSRLKPYDRNANVHPPKQIEDLRASLRQFGWTIPLLVREDGTIIAGHGRLEAAKLEGHKVAPVIVARGWSEEKCRAYTLVDNELAKGSQLDRALAALEVKDLKAIDGNLGLPGFDAAKIKRMLAPIVPVDTGPQLSGLVYSIVVRCESETQQGELLDKFEKQGLKCDALIS